jgi:hypothetical protein
MPARALQPIEIDDEVLAALPGRLRQYAGMSAGLDERLYELLMSSARLHELTRARLLELERRPSLWQRLFG